MADMSTDNDGPAEAGQATYDCIKRALSGEEERRPLSILVRANW
jgi:hypothetical protein